MLIMKISTDSPAVKAYRDQFKLNCSEGRRKDIDATVTNLDLWKSVLENWGYIKNGKWIKFSPLSVGKMLAEYERREKQSKRPNDSAGIQRQGLSERSEAGVSKWGDRSLHHVREAAGVHDGANYKTLDEVIAGALRQKDRFED